MKVYQAINKVQATLAKTGIGKDRKNQQQGYSFRGIDDMYNALAPLLADNGLCILPRVLSRHCEERTTRPITRPPEASLGVFALRLTISAHLSINNERRSIDYFVHKR